MGGTIYCVVDEPLIHREEITAALLALHDINENVADLVDIFGEDGMAKRRKMTPEELAEREAQKSDQQHFRELSSAAEA